MKKSLHLFLTGLLLLVGPFLTTFLFVIVMTTIGGGDMSTYGVLSFALIPIYLVAFPASIIFFALSLVQFFYALLKILGFKNFSLPVTIIFALILLFLLFLYIRQSNNFYLMPFGANPQSQLSPEEITERNEQQKKTNQRVKLSQIEKKGLTTHNTLNYECFTVRTPPSVFRDFFYREARKYQDNPESYLDERYDKNYAIGYSSDVKVDINLDSQIAIDEALNPLEQIEIANGIRFSYFYNPDPLPVQISTPKQYIEDRKREIDNSQIKEVIINQEIILLDGIEALKETWLSDNEETKMVRISTAYRKNEMRLIYIFNNNDFDESIVNLMIERFMFKETWERGQGPFNFNGKEFYPEICSFASEKIQDRE